nr:rRNA methyltransferase 3, mitochondrial [Leptinotarsa decemlineata]
MTNIFCQSFLKLSAYKKITKLNCQVRWSRRSPIRVIPSEEYDEVEDVPLRTKISSKEYNADVSPLRNNSRYNLSKYNPRSKTFKPLTISKSSQNVRETKKYTTVDMLETIIDSDGNCVYTKLKNNDSRISSILAEVKSKKERTKNDLILLEGKRLIQEALLADCKLSYILFSRLKDVEDLKPHLPKMGAKLYKMPYREIQMWSGLTTSPGIMGIFRTPDVESFKFPPNSLPVTIICDNIREASNLGAVLRTCCGVGCKEIILTKGCVNVWDSKVLRSACGAHFRLQIKKKADWEEITKTLPPSSAVYIADNNTISAELTGDEAEQQNLAELVQSVPVLPYYSVSFNPSSHIVVIIGGETEGISENSYKLAKDFNGVRLNVPLSNDVESLNTGVALGVIAFEIKRQLMNLQQMKS